MSADGTHDYVYAQTLGIGEIDSNVSIYPNPTNGIVNINAEGVINIVVMNALGQVVFETVENQIDLSQFGNGLFMLRIETESGVSVQRIMEREASDAVWRVRIVLLCREARRSRTFGVGVWRSIWKRRCSDTCP